LRLAASILGGLALLAAVQPDVLLSAKVTRESSDLLVPVTVTIALRNPSQTSVIATFLTTDLYEVEIRDEHTQLWSSLFGHKPIDIERRIPIPPGITPLGALIWDGTTNDHRSLGPGTYTVRVSILGSLVHPQVDVPIRFETPTPIASALTLAPGTAVTVAGEVARIEGGAPLISGDGDSLRLSRLPEVRAQGDYVVRGHIMKVNGAIMLVVERAVPAFDNLDPEAAPPSPRPAMTLMPVPRSAGSAQPKLAPKNSR
jgi:hypothetical protein